ncbi:MAG: ferritin [Candidatus Omnitrophota bacterium]
MIDKKMVKGITRQINREIYSGYFYLAMASYAQDAGLAGVANWFNIQLQEELGHARKLYAYLQQRNVRVMLEGIESPPQDFSSITDLFKQTLEHEKKVTAMITDLINMAIEQKDRATEIMLQWFVTEQVEEEASVQEILQKLKVFGEKGDALLMIDRELAGRTSSSSA